LNSEEQKSRGHQGANEAFDENTRNKKERVLSNHRVRERVVFVTRPLIGITRSGGASDERKKKESTVKKRASGKGGKELRGKS